MQYLRNISFFNWLEAKLAELPVEYQELPTDMEPPLPFQKAVGRLSKDQVRFFGFCSELATKLASAVREHAEAHTKGEDTNCEEKRSEIATLHEQHEVVRELFWLSVKHDLKAEDNLSNLKVCAGGVVVGWKPEDDPSARHPLVLGLGDLGDAGMLLSFFSGGRR